MSDNNDSVVVIYCTCPDTATARDIGHALVAHRLVACANLLTNVESIYRWQGQVETDAEQLLLLKTLRGLIPQVSAKIVELHPYEVPEIIAAPIVDGSQAYLEWVKVSVRTTQDAGEPSRQHD